MRLQSSLCDGGDRRDLTQGWEGRTKGVVSKYDAWARMDPEFRTIFIIISEFFLLFVVTERNQKRYCVGCFLSRCSLVCVEDDAICYVFSL